MTGRRQSECSAEWRSRAAALAERVLRLGTSAPADALQRARRDGGWSPAQVLEHLVLTSESYLAVMRQLVEGTPPPPLSDPRWRPRLAGRLLVRALESPRPLPAPRGFRPGLDPRPHVVDALVEEMHELDALLARAADLPWNSLRFGSPVLGLLRLNLGDGCLILLTHAERHLAQIDRALGEAG